MDILILTILLAILIWNIKQGFEMIDERLKDICESIEKTNRDDID